MGGASRAWRGVLPCRACIKRSAMEGAHARITGRVSHTRGPVGCIMLNLGALEAGATKPQCWLRCAGAFVSCLLPFLFIAQHVFSGCGGGTFKNSNNWLNNLRETGSQIEIRKVRSSPSIRQMKDAHMICPVLWSTKMIIGPKALRSSSNQGNGLFAQ